MELKFRALRADETECRIAMVRESGLSLLIYKDARCDQNILDETVGPMNWKKDYQLIDGQLFCTVYIWDAEKGEWIGKQDVGVESNTEAEKGRASDAQKRAAFCWGLGRELYTAPFIWIPADCTTGIKDRKCFDRFNVSEMEVTDGKITKLTIVNASKKNQVVFQMGAKAKAEKPVDIEAEISELAKRAGVQMSVIRKQAKTDDLNTLDAKTYGQLKAYLLSKINGTV